MTDEFMSRVWSPRPGWMDAAACRGLDPNLFFPETKGTNASRAKQVCQTCPVVEPCLDHAISTFERGGVWGGLNTRERAAFRNCEHVTREPRPREHGTVAGYNAHIYRGEPTCTECKAALARYRATHRRAAS